MSRRHLPIRITFVPLPGAGAHDHPKEIQRLLQFEKSLGDTCVMFVQTGDSAHQEEGALKIVSSVSETLDLTCEPSHTRYASEDSKS